jgi:hypothetical protein
MTYDSLKSKLNTHATTAGIKTFLFGSPELLNNQREKNPALLYPILLVVPPVFQVTTAASFVTEFEFWIVNDYTKAARATATQEEVWDYCMTLAGLFKTAINTDASLIIAVDTECTPCWEGVTVNKDLGIMFKTKITIFC